MIAEILAIKELRVRKNGSLERSCVCIAVGKEIRSLVCSNLRWYRLGMKMSHAGIYPLCFVYSMDLRQLFIILLRV